MDLHSNGTSTSGRRLSTDRPGSAISARDKGKGKALAHAGPEGVNGDRGGKYGLGERPDLDTAKAEELCGIEEGMLSYLILIAHTPRQSPKIP